MEGEHCYADVGINLTDSTYRGEYHGRKAHEEDINQVLERAQVIGCKKFMITGSDLEESQRAIELAKQFPGLCYATVGVHPCSANQFDGFDGGSEALLKQLEDLAREGQANGTVAAFGEIGLDYDRLHLTPKEQQLKYFEAQLDLATKLSLPLFLHSRAAAQDFERLLRPRLAQLPRGGLVHSFTGTLEEMRQLLALGLDIGVNGCSLKTEENLAVVRQIPLDRLHLETDGPWCEIRPSHASSRYLTSDERPMLPVAVRKEKWQRECRVKGRNESCTIVQVAHVVAAVRGITVAEVAVHAWENSRRVFGLDMNARS